MNTLTYLCSEPLMIYVPEEDYNKLVTLKGWDYVIFDIWVINHILINCSYSAWDFLYNFCMGYKVILRRYTSYIIETVKHARKHILFLIIWYWREWQNLNQMHSYIYFTNIYCILMCPNIPYTRDLTKSVSNLRIYYFFISLIGIITQFDRVI